MSPIEVTVRTAALDPAVVTTPVRAGPRSIPSVPKGVETLSAREILRVTLDTLGSERVALAAAFGPECIVIIDLLTQLTPAPRLFTLDTGRLPQETHDLLDRVRRRFGVAVEVVAPDAGAVQAMVTAKGSNLFYESAANRLECCDVRKVQPLRRALVGLDGWITGVRRDQTLTRARTPKIGLDLEYGLIWKVAPLADWTSVQVWDHILAHDLPYNVLHDRGFPSIGCAPCTRAVAPGDDPRSGRWWWEETDHRECGLHVSHGVLDGSPPLAAGDPAGPEPGREEA
jgi:phosphoadenosine phosphosulfate reductase